MLWSKSSVILTHIVDRLSGNANSCVSLVALIMVMALVVSCGRLTFATLYFTWTSLPSFDVSSTLFLWGNLARAVSGWLMTPVHVEQSFTVTVLFFFLTFAWEQESGTCPSQNQLEIAISTEVMYRLLSGKVSRHYKDSMLWYHPRSNARILTLLRHITWLSDKDQYWRQHLVQIFM